MRKAGLSEYSPLRTDKACSVKKLLNSLIKYIKNQFYTCLIVVNCDMCFHFAVLGLLV